MDDCQCRQRVQADSKWNVLTLSMYMRLHVKWICPKSSSLPGVSPAVGGVPYPSQTGLACSNGSWLRSSDG